MVWPFPMQSAHPMVVHLPIALLLTSAGIDVAAWILRRPAWHRIGLWNLGLGTVGAALAVFTGLRAEEVAKHSFEIAEVMERHEKLGIAVLIGSLMLLGWRLQRRDQLSPRGRLLATLGSVLVVALLAYAAHLGGRLVYEFGVGGRFGQGAP